MNKYNWLTWLKSGSQMNKFVNSFFRDKGQRSKRRLSKSLRLSTTLTHYNNQLVFHLPADHDVAKHFHLKLTSSSLTFRRWSLMPVHLHTVFIFKRCPRKQQQTNKSKTKPWKTKKQDTTSILSVSLFTCNFNGLSDIKKRRKCIKLLFLRSTESFYLLSSYSY